MVNSLPLPSVDVRHSIFARIVRRALVFALLALAALFAVTTWESWKATERSLAATVDTDIAGLADIYASGGEAELLERLDDRASLVSLEGRQARYMAVRPDGTVLAGNVDVWPKLGAALSEAGFLTLSDGTPVYARATRLAPDLDLLVARTYERDRDALLRQALVFLAVASLIVLACWWLGRRAARSLRRRIAAIATAFREAEAGREPTHDECAFDDEIGELAELSTRAIMRSANLARTHRHMSDHIAHEIRTPLTLLDNRLLNAMRKLPEGADPALLEECRRDIRSVVSMLDSLLDIASSEARAGDPAGLVRLDLSALATDLADLYSGSAEEAGITLDIAIEPDVTMMGEPMQITRLISNLLDNALKYVPRGGKVKLSVSRGPVIEVSDNGPGIEPTLRPLVFDRFRAGQAPSGKTSHGLGLALARAIALRHGLEIGLLDSERGAHFAVMPAALWQVRQISQKDVRP